MASKKKVSGNTMTLRDFHGGSIPSDLPLPSAPSQTVKPSDRSGYERGPAWGNRSRTHTSPSTKHFDETAPFLAHSAQIGRIFDEDERKPLDAAVSAPPRRTFGGGGGDDGTLQLQGASRFFAAAARSGSGGTSAWSSPNAVSKLVHSSSLDKVSSSSATWHPSKTLHHQAPQRVEEHFDGVLARHAERGLAIADDRDAERGVAYHDADGVKVPRSFGKLGGGAAELQRPVPSEPTERPKLKLLPRAKALESSEPAFQDYVQVHGQANSVKLVSDGTGSGKEAGHRPKLNLKPRLQPLEQLEGTSERDRNALFGGARPRELVLKERGVDDVAINNLDVVEHSNRLEHTTARAEKLPDHSHQARYSEKNEGAPNDRWTGKKLERKEQRVDAERINAQGRNWRSDNQRNMQGTDRKQVSERQPSPETWRKPAEQPKPASAAVSTSHGKAASAVELAQAFSRSGSVPKVDDRFSSERGANTNRPQVPFSRLVGPTTPSTPRPQINGY